MPIKNGEGDETMPFGQRETKDSLPGMGLAPEREPGNSPGEGPSGTQTAMTEAQRKIHEQRMANLTAIGQGRPKGVQNRLTRHMKECIEEAFERAGGVDYLVRIANGNTADRTAFMALLGRLLPMQVNSNIDQRIRVELPWLAQRTIGKTLPSDAELLARAGKAGDVVDGELTDPPDGQG